MITSDQTTLAELDILHTVSQAIAETTDENHLIKQATKLIGESLFPDNFGFLLVDDNKAGLVVHPSYRINKKLRDNEFFVPFGEGVVGHVAKTGLPQRIADVSTFPNYINIDSKTRSELAVPLILGKRTIGVINAESEKLNGFSEADERFLVILASQISMAIARFRTAETERRNAEELAVLLELSQKLTQQLDIDHVLEETYNGVTRLLDTSNFYIGLLDHEKQHVSFPININESVRDYESLKTIEPTHGLTGHILQTKAPILIKENAEDWQKENNIEICGEIPVSWLGVPLLIGNKVIGAMAIQDYKNSNVYDEHDLEILTAIASQAAIAIENARLFNNTQKRLQEQTVLHETTEILSSTLEYETILKQLTKQLCTAIDATSAYICEFDSKLDTYTVTVEYIGPNACEKERVSDLGTTYYRINYAHEDLPFLERLQQGMHGIQHHDDPDLSQATIDDLEQYGAKSILYVPLTVKGQLIGYLELYESRHKREFTNEEINLCFLLSQQAATAIENARLFENTQKRLQEQTILRKATEILSSTLDLDTILNQLTKQLCTAIDATSAYLSEIDEKQGVFTVISEYFSPYASDEEKVSDLGESYTINAPKLDDRSTYDDTLLLEKLRRGLPTIFQIDDPEIPINMFEELEKYGVKSALYIPLASKGQLIGYSEIYDSRHKREFSYEEINLCFLLSQQAASAIENARMFDSTRKRLQEQTILRETTELLSSTLDLDTILKRLIKQLCKAIDATSAYITEIDDKQGELINIAEYFSPNASDNEMISDLGERYPIFPTELDEDSTEDEIQFLKTLRRGQYEVDHIDDPETSKSQIEEMNKWGVKSILYIPLKAKGQLIGYSELWESRHRREFTPEEINLCVLLSQQAATAIENARLFENTQKRLREQTILRESAEIISSSLDSSAILTQLAKQICEAIDATSAYITEVDDKFETYTVTAEFISSNACDEEKISDLGITSSIANDDEILFIEHLKQGLHEIDHIDDPSLSQTSRKEMKQYGAKSIMYIPLTAKRQLIGFTDIWESRHKREFTSEEINLCVLLSQQAATAIENARLFEMVKRYASRDVLTEVYSRRRLLELAQVEFNRSHRYKRSLSAMMLDIDNFKDFNDTYGHVIGDVILKDVAKICEKTMRNTDILGRFGGDEFVILLTETRQKGAKKVAERLRKNIAKSTISTEKGDLKVTVSIGLSENTKHTPNLETLIARADQAMYVAKEKGRNQIATSR